MHYQSIDVRQPLKTNHRQWGIVYTPSKWVFLYRSTAQRLAWKKMLEKNHLIQIEQNIAKNKPQNEALKTPETHETSNRFTMNHGGWSLPDFFVNTPSFKARWPRCDLGLVCFWVYSNGSSSTTTAMDQPSINTPSSLIIIIESSEYWTAPRNRVVCWIVYTYSLFGTIYRMLVTINTAGWHSQVKRQTCGFR